MQISCSILSSVNRLQSIHKLNTTNVDYLHIDVMDGKFVTNQNFSLQEIEEAIKNFQKKVDIHLMVEKPIEYISKLDSQKINNITIHEEINENLNSIIKAIKHKGYKVGLSIKPNTPVNNLIPYLQDIDIILIMSVEPGYGKQKFIENTFTKIDQVNKLRQQYPHIQIEVDGGVNDQNINQLKDHQVDISVVGSFITNYEDYQTQINKLKQ